MESKMKAFIRIDAIDQELQLKEVPIPVIQPDEVLIKVAAFGVGIHDRYFIPNNVDFPYVIGSEGAGTIVELGGKVTDFSIGDRVIFTTVLQPQGGSWAEYAYAKKTALIPLPDNMTFAQGASIPIAGKAALESMRDLELNKEDTLFIAGASGAIGTFLIQIANAQGILVSSSASTKNQEYMQSLGAEKTVDYTHANWINHIKEWSNGGVTAALAIQPNTGKDSIKVVKNGGKLITVSGDSSTVLPEREIHVQQMGHRLDTHQEMIAFTKAISRKEINVIIEKKYPFEEALKALRKTETRHARGKSVVLVNR